MFGRLEVGGKDLKEAGNIELLQANDGISSNSTLNPHLSHHPQTHPICLDFFPKLFLLLALSISANGKLIESEKTLLKPSPIKGAIKSLARSLSHILGPVEFMAANFCYFTNGFNGFGDYVEKRASGD
jgi:hypothetical protein